MHRVSVWYHKDGDHLVIHDTPWWAMGIEWFADRFLCPCCGFTGFLSQWKPFAYVFCSIWNRAIELPDKHGKMLLKQPVDGCEASKALFDDHICDCCDPEEEEEEEENARAQ